MPDLQLHFVIGKLVDHGRKTVFGHGYSCHVCLLRPKSRGSVRLASTDPLAAPLIDPAFLADRDDMRRMVRGFKLMRRHAGAAGAGAPSAAASCRPRPRRKPTRRSSSSSATTPTPSTTRWAAAAWGRAPLDVVDAQLRVHGVQGLRVVDASIMPRIVVGQHQRAGDHDCREGGDMISARGSGRQRRAALRSTRRMTLKLSVLDQSTSLRRPRAKITRIRDTLALAAALRRAGLPPLLGQGAPQPADHRRQRAGDADGGDRGDARSASASAAPASCCRTTRRSRWPSSSACWMRWRRGASTSASAARRAPTCARRMALNPHAQHAADDFPAAGAGAAAWAARRALPPGHPSAASARCRRAARRPQIWILGSSDYGAQLAAHFGLPYAFAYFFTDGQGAEEALALYRSNYQPSERHPQPIATICVWALAADTEAEARHHALSRERWRVDRQRGISGPLQRPTTIRRAASAPSEMPARARPCAAARSSARRTQVAEAPRAGRRLGLDEWWSTPGRTILRCAAIPMRCWRGSSVRRHGLRSAAPEERNPPTEAGQRGG